MLAIMSRRQYDTHGFDRQRYQIPVQPSYLDEYARALPLTMSYAERPQMRSAPIATPVERHQLEADPESQGPNPRNRQRVPVAVSSPNHSNGFMSRDSLITVVCSLPEAEDKMQRRSGQRIRMPEL